MNNKTINKIKKRMIDSGIKSNQQLADIIGCTRQAISMLFKGIKMPYIEAKVMLWYKGELK